MKSHRLHLRLCDHEIDEIVEITAIMENDDMCHWICGGSMKRRLIFLIFLFSIIFAPSTQARELDLHDEIIKQERPVSIRYKPGKKSLIDFKRKYPHCRKFKGARYKACNHHEAKRRYAIYLEKYERHLSRAKHQGEASDDLSVELQVKR